MDNRVIKNIESVTIDFKRNVVMTESRDNVGNFLHGEYEISTLWKDGIPSMEPTLGQ